MLDIFILHKVENLGVAEKWIRLRKNWNNMRNWS